MDVKYFLDKLPKEEFDKIDSVESVSNKVTLGKVWIAFLDENKQEGYLFLPEKSGIKEHKHTTCCETCKHISGDMLQHNGRQRKQAIVHGEGIQGSTGIHSIAPVTQPTIIKFTKQKYMPLQHVLDSLAKTTLDK